MMLMLHGGLAGVLPRGDTRHLSCTCSCSMLDNVKWKSKVKGLQEDRDMQGRGEDAAGMKGDSKAITIPHCELNPQRGARDVGVEQIHPHHWRYSSWAHCGRPILLGQVG